MPSYKDQMYGYYYDKMSLSHHGVLGQKWGVRRYQNPDGTRTAAGKRHDAKQEYKTEKKAIAKTRNKLLEKDDGRISDDALWGKTSFAEARRRGANTERLRYQQAKAHKLAAKSEMNAKLAENSKGLSKKVREFKSESQAKKADTWSKEAGKTKKMIEVTNDVYNKRLNAGEKIASELFMTNYGRNMYYSNRKNMSATEAVGRTVAQTMLNYAVASAIE